MRKLESQNLAQSDPEVGKRLCVHAEVDYGIQQLVSKHESLDVAQLVDAVVFEHQQIDLVDEGGHMGVVLQGPSLQLPAGEDELLVELEDPVGGCHLLLASRLH